MNMIKSDEIEILEDSVKNGEISNRKGNTMVIDNIFMFCFYFFYYYLPLYICV